MEQIIFYQAGVATGGLLPIQKTLSGMMVPDFLQCYRIDSGI
jgi:hypothetical protein